VAKWGRNTIILLWPFWPSGRGSEPEELARFLVGMRGAVSGEKCCLKGPVTLRHPLFLVLFFPSVFHPWPNNPLPVLRCKEVSMEWSSVSFDPPPRILRQFAGACLVVGGAFACWQGLLRGNVLLAMVFGALAAILGPLGLVFPRAIRPIYVAATVAAFPIGWLVSRVALALIFYGIFTPVAILFRLIGRDALDRARVTSQQSYWQPKPAPADMKQYFRQF
jgi:hypothetical protein